MPPKKKGPLKKGTKKRVSSSSSTTSQSKSQPTAAPITPPLKTDVTMQEDKTIAVVPSNTIGSLEIDLTAIDLNHRATFNVQLSKFRALVKSPEIKHITIVNLKCDNLLHQQLLAIAIAKNPHVETLHLKNKRNSNLNIGCWTKRLEQSASLRQLDITGFGKLSPEASNELIALVRVNQRITRLTLSKCTMDTAQHDILKFVVILNKEDKTSKMIAVRFFSEEPTFDSKSEVTIQTSAKQEKQETIPPQSSSSSSQKSEGGSHFDRKRERKDDESERLFPEGVSHFAKRKHEEPHMPSTGDEKRRKFQSSLSKTIKKPLTAESPQNVLFSPVEDIKALEILLKQYKSIETALNKFPSDYETITKIIAKMEFLNLGHIRGEPDSLTELTSAIAKGLNESSVLKWFLWDGTLCRKYNTEDNDDFIVSEIIDAAFSNVTLQRVTLKMNDEDVLDYALPPISRLIEKYDNLTELDINYSCEDLLHSIFDAASKSKRLTTLKVQYTDLALPYFEWQDISCPSITELSLDEVLVRDDTIDTFLKALPGFTNLKNLSISLRYLNTDNTIRFLRAIAEIPTLEILELRDFDIPRKAPENWQAEIFDALSQHPHLTQLKIQQNKPFALLDIPLLTKKLQNNKTINTLHIDNGTKRLLHEFEERALLNLPRFNTNIHYVYFNKLNIPNPYGSIIRYFCRLNIAADLAKQISRDESHLENLKIVQSFKLNSPLTQKPEDKHVTQDKSAKPQDSEETLFDGLWENFRLHSTDSSHTTSRSAELPKEDADFTFDCDLSR